MGHTIGHIFGAQGHSMRRWWLRRCTTMCSWSGCNSWNRLTTIFCKPALICTDALWCRGFAAVHCNCIDLKICNIASRDVHFVYGIPHWCPFQPLLASSAPLSLFPPKLAFWFIAGSPFLQKSAPGCCFFLICIAAIALFGLSVMSPPHYACTIRIHTPPMMFFVAISNW